MKLETTLSRITIRLVMLVVTAVFVFESAQALAQRVRVDVPYQFTVGSKILPAGRYMFTVKRGTPWIGVHSVNGKAAAQTLIISRLTGTSEFLQEGALVFATTGGHRILAEVWIPGSAGFLLHSVAKNYERDVLTFSSLSKTRTVRGKTAYNLTCARCHGKKGTGNTAADKFFGTKIPRLNSAEVQNKTDAELKEIINRGTKAMPPVEVDEGNFRHLLPSQDVDAVITYIRTLKK